MFPQLSDAMGLTLNALIDLTPTAVHQRRCIPRRGVQNLWFCRGTRSYPSPRSPSALTVVDYRLGLLYLAERAGVQVRARDSLMQRAAESLLKLSHAHMGM